VNYAELVNCAEDIDDWSQRHPLLAQCTSTERFLICHRVLEELQERLVIDYEALGQEEFERCKRAAFNLQDVWSIGRDEKPELPRSVITCPVPSDVKTPGLEGLLIKGAFGWWLKARKSVGCR